MKLWICNTWTVDFDLTVLKVAFTYEEAKTLWIEEVIAKNGYYDGINIVEVTEVDGYSITITPM